MFTKIRNIDTAFRYIRFFTLAIVIGSFLVCGLVIHHGFALMSGSQNKIYVLANGKVLEAFAADRKENLSVEARDHIKMFHQCFFTLHPDDKAIQAGITRALYLADESAKRQYENMKENGYYSNIIAGNISQEIVIDSVSLATIRYPYYFRCYATEEIIRAATVVTRLLVTEGYLRNTVRTDNNPHGFLIERWNTIENKDLKTVNR